MTYTPTFALQIDSVLVRYGERSAPGKGASKGGSANSDGGKSPVSVGASSPSRSGRGSSKGGGKGDGGKGGGGSGHQQAGGGGGRKSRKDWVRYDGAAMLLSSAGWSEDEDEEKEELITSEIEKFRQKQVQGRVCRARENEG